jgi:hypothetical protein
MGQVILTEEELKTVLRESVRKALIKEHIDYDREIRLAQKTLCKFPLSDVGLRLEGTQFYTQYRKMHDAIVELNDSLISYIRGGK